MGSGKYCKLDIGYLYCTGVVYSCTGLSTAFPFKHTFLLLIILLASVANHYLASKISNVLSSILK